MLKPQGRKGLTVPSGCCMMLWVHRELDAISGQAAACACCSMQHNCSLSCLAAMEGLPHVCPLQASGACASLTAPSWLRSPSLRPSCACIRPSWFLGTRGRSRWPKCRWTATGVPGRLQGVPASCMGHEAVPSSCAPLVHFMSKCDCPHAWPRCACLSCCIRG